MRKFDRIAWMMLSESSGNNNTELDSATLYEIGRAVEYQLIKILKNYVPENEASERAFQVSNAILQSLESSNPPWNPNDGGG